MSKERLEEVKHFVDLINFIPRDSRGMGEMDVVNVQEDMQWLIEQAGRVQELEQQNKRYREVINQIKNNIPSEFNHRTEYEAKKNVIRLINIDNLVNEYLEGEE